MPSFDQSIVSLTGRLTHQWDFTFYKNNGEIANRVRSELGASFKQITIDKDGDLDIDTVNRGSFWVNPGGIISAGWVTDSKTLSSHQEIEKFAHIIELLAKSKGLFINEFYNVRLFFRFTPENGLTLLRDRSFESTLRLMLGEKAPSDIQSIKFSSSYTKDKFFDLIEIEASPQDIQLRYSRTGVGTEFASYSEFLSNADLTGLVNDLKAFAEVLLAAEPQPPVRSLFGERKQSR
jgi:hypothetical protein